jgi:Uma2 family endonuclease
MSTPTHAQPERGPSTGAPTGAKKGLPVIANDMPILYEDEGQEEIGESIPHTDADHDLSMGIKEHLRGQPTHNVASNLNVYYHPTDRRAYVSPDVMVVVTPEPLPRVSSYTIGPGRPAPILVIEILSRRSFQQQDLTNKPDIYGRLGVAEYILVDSTGEFLHEKVLLKRWVDSDTWDDEQDSDGGVTSRLGFRIVIEEDNRPRVIDLKTGRRYLRPDEAHAAVAAEAEAKRKAEDRVRELEAELAKLRGQPGA